MTDEPTDPAFESLLEFLRDERGFDFTGYKRASLKRRVTKRMREVEIDSFGTYHNYLQENPDEFAFLFNTILINVTAFFRDREAWDYLGEHVLPEFVEAKPSAKETRSFRSRQTGKAALKKIPLDYQTEVVESRDKLPHPKSNLIGGNALDKKIDTINGYFAFPFGVV